MNKLLLIFCLLSSANAFSQSEKEVKFLDYAGHKVEVPKNCSAISKHELLDCDGVSVQWTYYDRKMLKSASERLLKGIGKKYTAKDPIEVVSFGATLKGYKFTNKDSRNRNRIIVYGIVNKQPLILNVASKDELIAITGFNEVLKRIMKVKM